MAATATGTKWPTALQVELEKLVGLSGETTPAVMVRVVAERRRLFFKPVIAVPYVAESGAPRSYDRWTRDVCQNVD